jgi:AhpD family alkylhydroperoxidase
MQVIKPIDPTSTSDRARDLLDGVHRQLGMIPNYLKTLAASAAALEMYLRGTDALENGTLPLKLRAQIALTVAECNRSRYCLAAGAAIGRTVGLSDEEIRDGRRGDSPNSKVNAALRFVRLLVEGRASRVDGEVGRLRRVGYGDSEIVEIIANVGLNITVNYFNRVAGTALDFPEVADLPAPRRGPEDPPEYPMRRGETLDSPGTATQSWEEPAQ